MRRSFTVALALTSALSALACEAVSGLDQFGPAPSKSNTGGSGNAGGGGGTTIGGGGNGGVGGVAEHCTDLAMSGDETDVDCGGSCMPCGVSQQCMMPSDCAEPLLCVQNQCSVGGCSDNVQNGNETGVDCGGGCPGCPVGASCGGPDDCITGICNGTTCECNDHLVLSEVRTRGPNGAADEFFELYNTTSSPIIIDDQVSIYAQSVGGVQYTVRWTGNISTSIPPGGFFLVTSAAYSGAIPGDDETQVNIADESSIQLRVGGVPVDQICLCEDVDCVPMFKATSGCDGNTAINPFFQAPLSDDNTLSRLAGGAKGHCIDTNAETDFQLVSPGNPKNTNSPPAP